MWTMTTDGFLSAVADRSNPDTLKIRSRDRKSLESLIKNLSTYTDHDLSDVKIITEEGTDYPYRVYIKKVVYAEYMALEVLHIGYPNFKDELKARRGTVYAQAASSIWYTLMRDITDAEAREAESARVAAAAARAPQNRRYRVNDRGEILPGETYYDEIFSRLGLHDIADPDDEEIWAEAATEDDWFLDRKSRGKMSKGRKRRHQAEQDVVPF